MSAAKARYRQLYEQIRAQIMSGDLPGGQRLPSKRELARQLGISVNTVISAYEQLADEGLIEARPRSGFYVEKLPLPPAGMKSLPQEAGTVCPGNGGQEKKAKAGTEIDFRSTQIDEKAFPFQNFRKLSRDLWSQDKPYVLRESPAEGWMELRREIAIYLASNRGLAARPENILIQAQSSALFELLLQLLAKDTTIALENPGYHSFYEIAARGSRPLQLLALEEEGIRPEDIPASGPLLLSVTPTHQYPTGAVMPASRRVELLTSMSTGAERRILEDDYDSEFRYEGKPLPSLKSLDSMDRVIYLGNFSKSVCPGLRVSYMVLPDELRERFEEKKGLFSCPVPSPIQFLLASFLAEGHYARHLRRMRALYQKKRQLMLSWLKEEVPEWKVIGAEAGFHLNVQLPQPVDQEKLRQKLTENGVRLSFLSDFDQSPAALKEEKAYTPPVLLLSFSSLSEEEMISGLRRIAATLDALDSLEN